MQWICNLANTCKSEICSHKKEHNFFKSCEPEARCGGICVPDADEKIVNFIDWMVSNNKQAEFIEVYKEVTGNDI